MSKLFTSLPHRSNQETPCIYNRYEITQKAKIKDRFILFPHAIRNPKAMVIKSSHTSPTLIAMLHPQQLHFFTYFTQLTLKASFTYTLIHLYWVVWLRTFLNQLDPLKIGKARLHQSYSTFLKQATTYNKIAGKVTTIWLTISYSICQ